MSVKEGVSKRFKIEERAAVALSSWWTYARVEADGLRVHSNTAELDQLLELNREGRHGACVKLWKCSKARNVDAAMRKAACRRGCDEATCSGVG